MKSPLVYTRNLKLQLECEKCSSWKCATKIAQKSHVHVNRPLFSANFNLVSLGSILLAQTFKHLHPILNMGVTCTMLRRKFYWMSHSISCTAVQSNMILTCHILLSWSMESLIPGNRAIPVTISTKIQPAPLNKRTNYQYNLPGELDSLILVNQNTESRFD